MGIVTIARVYVLRTDIRSPRIMVLMSSQSSAMWSDPLRNVARKEIMCNMRAGMTGVVSYVVSSTIDQKLIVGVDCEPRALATAKLDEIALMSKRHRQLKTTCD